MIVVGLTGGMGSGKTTVLKMFQDLGVCVYGADVEAKKLMNESIILKKKIVEIFGETSYKEGVLNRSYISGIVFNKAEKLNLLNAVVHPAVQADFKKFIENSKGAYVVYESAILLQGSAIDLFDYIIIITAPLPIRLERIMKRDATDEIEIKKRLMHQSISKDALLNADFVIENIALNATNEKIIAVHNKIVKNSRFHNK